MASDDESAFSSENVFMLRVVPTAGEKGDGDTHELSGRIVIGRDAACDVVVDEGSVSRNHASVEPVAGGLRVVDLDSGNGVWMGATRVTDVVLQGGERFRIGSTIFEYAAPPATTSAEDIDQDAEEARSDEPFLIRIVKGGDANPTGSEFILSERLVTLGRDPDCSVVLDQPDISRRHARLEVLPNGIRLTDLESTCGTWLDDRQITSELILPDQSFRLGRNLVLQCHRPQETPLMDGDATRVVAEPELPPALVEAVDVAEGQAVEESAKEEEGELGQTVVMPVPVDLLAGAWRIENEGELQTVSAHKPFLLDDPGSAWYVVTGGLLIFTVGLEKGEPVGTRTHFLGLVPGQMCMGFDLKRYGIASGFLAVATRGTTVRKIPVDRLKRLSEESGPRTAIANLIDMWVGGLSTALVANIPVRRENETAISAGEKLSLDVTGKATSADGVLWISLWSGSVVFNDMSTPRFARRDVLFPVTPQSWIRPVSDEFGPIVLSPVKTVDIVDERLWTGIDVFHEVLCECEFIGKKLVLADEVVRLQQKAQHSEAAQEAAYDAIGSVLSSEGSTPEGFLTRGEAEPILQACQIVGHALGLTVVSHPADEESLTYEEQIASIATASGFRTRVVALRDRWFKEDNGPLLGQLTETKEPVPLVPKGANAYEWVDLETGTRNPVTAEMAETLSGFAYAFYRPLPEGALRVADVIRFGGMGVRKDLMWVLYMAIIVGVFGTITPFITGQVFDVAIPQAQRTALLGLGAALVIAAAASAAFKFTQGVATVRIQTRMTSVIQSAVWDRILNLPTTFFRQFSAGDLADRAQGVDAIQNLISGAGVAAILGSVSGLFFVVQMFILNIRLALLAVLLTVIFVSTNMLLNYLQLRYQRAELQYRGRITGLVLNLLTGVTKLRVCGAERHAFRVWAEQFAQQRRISFTVGTIQNIAAVFAGIFPLISSIAIFATMLLFQRSVADGAELLTTGDFIAFNAAYGLFLTAMQALGDASLSLLRVLPLYERLEPILTTLPEVDSSKSYPGQLTGRIELSHVYFRYDPDGPWIINDVSLVIEPGEFVAFVGSSGGGKSTLLRLMLGFEQPTRGLVLYDGQDLNSLDMRMVRQQLGVVLQTSRVMPTEIYRNIVGVTSRTLEDAWDAAEKAGLAEDIKNMPMGMHTYVAEGGGTLSGGQRQRLMIARAIVSKPKVLFLDEATSALDNRAQSTVTESMDRMEATRIVIAHRLSTVVTANRICYLHGGSIAEVGTYEELMELDGKFAQLAKRQTA